MAQSEKDFLIRVRADIRQATAELKKISGGIASTGDNAKKSAGNIGGMEKSINRLQAAAGGYLTLRFARQLILEADAFNVLQVRIRTATKATGDYEKVSRDLYKTSQDNGVALSTTVSLFQNLARAAPELGATTQEALDLTKAVQQLGVISGSSKANLDAGLLQFSQAMSSGVVRAEEFNSLLENVPELAARIAKGMGLSTGELRNQVVAGKVLSREVFAAILKQAGEINREFAEIPDSVVRAGTSVDNSFSRFLSTLDQSVGLTKQFTYEMGLAAKSLDNWSDLIKEDELAAAMRRRAELAQELYSEQKRNSALNWAVVGRIKKEIDLVDAKIIELNKKRAAELDKSGSKTKKPAPETPEEKIARARIDATIKALELEAMAYGSTAREAALYKLEMLGATDAQLKKADAALKSVEDEMAFADAVAASEQAVKDENAAYQDWLKTLESEGASVYDSTRTGQEKLASGLERLDLLLAAGKISWDTYARAMFDALDKSDASDKLDGIANAGVSAMEELTAATKGWGDEFTNTLADMVQKGKGNFSDLADSIIKDLLKIAIYQTITRPVLEGLGIIGPAPVAKADGGYISGPGTGTSDSIPARLSNGEFVQPANAVSYYGANFMESIRRMQLPKFAGGGMVSTVRRPSVAHFAEGGLVSGQGQGGGSVRVEFENKGSAKQVESSRARMDPDGLVISIVTKDVGRDGPISQALAQTFNLQRHTS